MIVYYAFPPPGFSGLPTALCSILSDIRISTRCNLRPERKADAAAAAAATAVATTPAATACRGCCLPLKNYWSKSQALRDESHTSRGHILFPDKVGTGPIVWRRRRGVSGGSGSGAAARRNRGSRLTGPAEENASSLGSLGCCHCR